LIGLFGIVSNETLLKRAERDKAFSLMMHSINKEDFNSTFVAGKHFSVGLTRRNIGENKDLALKLIRDDFAVGFCGYGKFRGERKLCWAEEMVDRIVPLYQDQGKNVLIQIEGSFTCLLIEDNHFYIISDRFSSKNLFYYQGGKVFLFAPDVGRIIDSEFVPREKELDAAKQVFVSGFFLDDSTLAKGVLRFPYATLIDGTITSPLKVDSRRYWDVAEREGIIDEITPDLVSEFSAKMERAIYELADLEQRTVVPLSGGLDSRMIAYHLSKKHKLATITYNLGEELRISERVSKALNCSRTYFSNKMIVSEDFKQALVQLVTSQRIHTVLNQYFHAPLFKSYFRENGEKQALYDGIYLDILFSAPYTYDHFDAEDFVGVYGRGTNLLSLLSKSLSMQDLNHFLKATYEQVENGFELADGVGRSQKAYLSGRLRRYVLEAGASRENYCAVLKPGFNYDLMDFGYSLSLRLRKGVLYLALFRSFPELANLPFKDSYGIREKTAMEKAKEHYVRFRLNLSYGTKGVVPYFTYQTPWFFLGKNQINEYRGLFLQSNCVGELFEDHELEAIFNKIKKKHWLFDLFQRVLFLQQFYRRYKF
jgi:hypothetical protein